MMTIAPAMNNGTKRLFNRRPVPMLMMFVLLGCLLSLGGCSDDEDSTFAFPNQPAPDSRDWLFDVYGTSASDIFVGGNKGVMYHYDGVSWEKQNMNTTAAITTIWLDPAEDAMYATGHRGHIWKYTGSSWSSMSSGTSSDLYGIGSFQSTIHAVGNGGTMRKLNGSSWGGVGSVMFLLDENSVPTDTLSVTKDLASMVAVNHFFIGGAFIDPNYEGPEIGTNGTRGNVLAINDVPDLTADWILRPISGEQIVEAEWVLTMTSDPVDLSLNYLGTSEGWLFRLTVDDDGKKVWDKFSPEITAGPGAGIRDIWLDANGNVYLVTDEGEVWYQTAGYRYGGTDPSEYRQLLFESHNSLVGIWGSGPDNIYFVGFYDEILFHGVHVPDPVTGTFTVDQIDIPFPDKATGGGSLAPGVDHIGRPLR